MRQTPTRVGVFHSKQLAVLDKSLLLCCITPYPLREAPQQQWCAIAWTAFWRYTKYNNLSLVRKRLSCSPRACASIRSSTPPHFEQNISSAAGGAPATLQRGDASAWTGFPGLTATSARISSRKTLTRTFWSCTPHCRTSPVRAHPHTHKQRLVFTQPIL